MPERSIGLAWKACVGLNQPWVRIPPCPPFLRKAKFTHAKVAKIAKGGEGIRLSGVKGGPIPPCPFLLRKAKFTHAKVAKGGEGMLFIYL